ncbi:hydroxyacid dehydrogenase [Lactiplantibacillus garii]|uniref:Hydroxyacid dehydrogenase n=1 Tax=Lactiplantibacillus garii TaxID=2306423 RepID=A0A426D6I5_9LACO|nr:NAD(P)-dependent oxidoreductase [Lactiplantibacillus garii]RRK10198.1 hydroxyacid dehydrogenase [Lactiplantibacillus garii]
MSKVYIAGRIPKAAEATLRQVELDVDVYDGEQLIDPQTLRSHVADADYLITPLSTPVDAATLAHAPKLKLIANFGVGTSNIDVQAALDRGIAVTNTPDVSAVATAESTVGLIVSLAHRIVEGDQLMRTRGFNGWAPLFFLGHELQGKTLGIVGLGQIGREVAKRLHAFDMPIVYYQRHRLPVEQEVQYGARYVSFDELLTQADVVSLHLTNNATTRHMIGAAEFKKMKPSALFINAARGQIVDEAALVNALTAHEIAGAALDVYEHEPAVEPALKRMANVILTPHLGNATVEARNAMAAIVTNNVLAAESGRPLCHLVTGVQGID